MWFKQFRTRNVPIGRLLLKEKPLMYAAGLGIADFRASDGWLGKFKSHHGINFLIVCGESEAVSGEVCNDWKSTIHNLIKNYDPSDVLSIDETGLLFKCIPDYTLTFEGEKCSGGKHSKERVTILLMAKIDGSKKWKPFIIDNPDNIGRFMNVDIYVDRETFQKHSDFCIELYVVQHVWCKDVSPATLRECGPHVCSEDVLR